MDKKWTFEGKNGTIELSKVPPTMFPHLAAVS